MKGYKAFNSDLTCRGFQFEIGKTYEHEGKIEPCESGFHFCKNLVDCYRFYDMSDETRICRVEAIGNIKTDDEVKYCTDKITILSEVKKPRLKSNLSDSNSGYCNSGNRNSGDWNSGNRNSGNWNSGDWNSGNSNSGIFNTDKNPKIKIFDKESDWTIENWIKSRARDVMLGCPYSYSNFIYESNMTEEEKERHPEHRTIGGYIKTVTITEADRQKWWDDLTEEDKEAVKGLPNFDADKFKECTGIEVESEG